MNLARVSTAAAPDAAGGVAPSGAIGGGASRSPDLDPAQPADGTARRAGRGGAAKRLVYGVAWAACIVAGVLALIWLVTGVDPWSAASRFVDGAAGDRAAIARTLVRAIPLVLVGLGATVGLRGGVVNVGGEGQMAMGAIGAVLVVQAIGADAPAPITWVLSIVVAAVGAALWAVVPAILAATRNVSEILSTLLVNLITVSVLLWLLELPLFADPDPYVITPQGKPIPDRAVLPRIWGDTTLHAGAVVAVAAVLACWWWRRTPSALRVDLVGANPNLAALSGLRPRRIRFGLLLVSASFAGVAAAVQLLGVSQRVTTGLTGGIGYTGVLVAVLGGRGAVGTAAAAVLFAVLLSGGEAMEFGGVPRSVTVLTQAIAVVAVAVASARRARS